MLFNSIEFIFFLIIVYLCYRLLTFQQQNLLLLIASYIFYGWWDVRFLFLIVLSTVIDFCAGLMIDKGFISQKNRYLISFYLIASSLFFLTLKWQYFTIDINNRNLDVDWFNFIPQDVSSWTVFLLTLGLTLIGNYLYFPLVKLSKNKKEKIFLAVSICANLGLLGVFKYFNFFIGSMESIFQGLGWQQEFPSLSIVLPVGISFYTFQTMSYTIDVYRKELKATDHFFDFALFVSYFPQLVAGPIERASQLLPKILAPRKLSFQQSSRGLYLILFGLFKKIAIADSVAKSVNAVYETTGTVSSLDIIVATILFALQIYCDFSGYSDIARGVSKLFGIELMYNFNLPYFSRNPSEFWRRWHISLSSWLKDYLYIPLGGNRRGNVYRNLMITMILGGLWHGAGWNFILWGFYQGALLCIYRFFAQSQLTSKFYIRYFSPSINRVMSTVIFFIFTCYGWLLFRANSFEQVFTFTSILLTNFSLNFSAFTRPTFAGIVSLPLLLIYEFCEFKTGNPKFYLNFPSLLRGAFIGLLFFFMVMGMSNEPAQFIYFQF